MDSLPEDTIVATFGCDVIKSVCQNYPRKYEFAPSHICFFQLLCCENLPFVKFPGIDKLSFFVVRSHHAPLQLLRCARFLSLAGASHLRMFE